MDGDESIPTSDAEEMEGIEASGTQYWESVTSMIKQNLDTLWVKSLDEDTPPRSTPPRKKRKVSICKPSLYVITYFLCLAVPS
jgi:hypothetical protein